MLKYGAQGIEEKELNLSLRHKRRRTVSLLVSDGVISMKSMPKIRDIEKEIRTAKRLAREKTAKGEEADEFVEIGDADGFKLYVAASESKQQKPSSFHENARDVFMYIIDGRMRLTFEDGEKVVIKKGQCFVLPKRLRHQCFFEKLTVTLEGVYEKGL